MADAESALADSVARCIEEEHYEAARRQLDGASHVQLGAVVDIIQLHSQQDWHGVLHVAPGASQQEVNQAYRCARAKGREAIALCSSHTVLQVSRPAGASGQADLQVGGTRVHPPR